MARTGSTQAYEFRVRLTLLLACALKDTSGAGAASSRGLGKHSNGSVLSTIPPSNHSPAMPTVGVNHRSTR